MTTMTGEPVLDSRARITFVNASNMFLDLDSEVIGTRERIKRILDQRFNGAQMVGGVYIELAREKEGWRVVSAFATGGHVGTGDLGPAHPPTDWRAQVAAALRDGGIVLAHQ